MVFCSKTREIGIFVIGKKMILVITQARLLVLIQGLGGLFINLVLFPLT